MVCYHPPYKLDLYLIFTFQEIRLELEPRSATQHLSIKLEFSDVRENATVALATLLALTDDDDEGNAREERAPRHRAHGVLDGVDRAGGRAKDEQLDVVQNKRDGLEEARRRTGETLEDHIGEEERRRLGQVLREQGRNRCGVVDELRKGGNDTGRERHDEERVLEMKAISI